ncbi:MAG TPA: Fe(2+)-trafficking protein [Acidobacteriota bacterium]|nr:Fe(2+)-trafficking protein [Acidobacteriota bacterium]
MTGEIDCQACGLRAKRDGTEIPEPPTGGPITGRIPFRGDLRQQVQDNVCAVCWAAWLEMQIKVINELALNLGDARSHDLIEAHASDFLGLSDGPATGTDFSKIGDEPLSTTH